MRAVSPAAEPHHPLAAAVCKLYHPPVNRSGATS